MDKKLHRRLRVVAKVVHPLDYLMVALSVFTLPAGVLMLFGSPPIGFALIAAGVALTALSYPPGWLLGRTVVRPMIRRRAAQLMPSEVGWLLQQFLRSEAEKLSEPLRNSCWWIPVRIRHAIAEDVVCELVAAGADRQLLEQVAREFGAYPGPIGDLLGLARGSAYRYNVLLDLARQVRSEYAGRPDREPFDDWYIRHVVIPTSKLQDGDRLELVSWVMLETAEKQQLTEDLTVRVAGKVAALDRQQVEAGRLLRDGWGGAAEDMLDVLRAL